MSERQISEGGQKEQRIQGDLNNALELQEWSDGSSYRGNVSMDVRMGYGEFRWVNGESYMGEFCKDHLHGKGIYNWPDGSKFIGCFYLSRKEGYGTMEFHDGRKYQGLYKSDVRFGPGIETYTDDCQDIGIWLRHHLIKLCTLAPHSFSISHYPEFCQQSNERRSNKFNSASLEEEQEEDPFLYSYKILLQDDSYTLPDRIHSYSTDADHLPLTLTLRKDLDLHYFTDYSPLYEPRDFIFYNKKGTSEMMRIHQHVHKHRNSPEHMSWDIQTIMSGDRDAFGPKGPRELVAEQLIEKAGGGDYESVYSILRHDLAHVDVADANGHTSLHAATQEEKNENVTPDAVGCEEDEPWQSCTKRENQVTMGSISLTNDQNKASSSSESEPKGLYSDESPPNYDTTVSEDILDQKTEGVSYSIEKESTLSEGSSALHKLEERNSRATIKLLLLRGADPNMCCIPMHAIFLAVQAADVSTVQLLLERGARTDVRMPEKIGALTPLHIAAALPGEEGVMITKMLLHAASDPNARAEDGNDIYKHDRGESASSVQGFPMKGCHASGLPLFHYYNKTTSVPQEGGRTPLHVACERDDDYKHARDIICLLLRHNADPNTLWSGHSPLSLAVASGNDLAVKDLLANGADPNLPLGRVGSALCAVVNVAYGKTRTLPARIALVDRLIKAGSSILMPITIGGGKKTALGSATDYAYYKFLQDKRIAHTPYHALLLGEREIYNVRKQLLEHMGNLTREAVTLKEKEWTKEGIIRAPVLHSDAETKESQKSTLGETDESLPRAFFKYCYQCGRSIGVKLTPCARCYSIYFCSKLCKKKSCHDTEECVRLTGKVSSKISLSQIKKTREKSTDVVKWSKNPPNKRDPSGRDPSGRDSSGRHPSGRDPRMHANREKFTLTSENYSFN
ncbi:ankyrin repeat and MYND domain-containing protein 1 isoform X3 [Ascaphus truei]|uniref:ankyrin repeat and MYND domain-containing protein 1 isoform X3 n=1 Tax=Ascaphus truei TaxID=8439 RepID=UPI003F5A319F